MFWDNEWHVQQWTVAIGIALGVCVVFYTLLWSPIMNGIDTAHWHNSVSYEHARFVRDQIYVQACETVTDPHDRYRCLRDTP